MDHGLDLEWVVLSDSMDIAVVRAEGAAETTFGGSGGAVLDIHGRVIAVNTGVMREFGGSNWRSRRIGREGFSGGHAEEPRRRPERSTRLEAFVRRRDDNAEAASRR